MSSDRDLEAEIDSLKDQVRDLREILRLTDEKYNERTKRLGEHAKSHVHAEYYY